MNYLRISFVLVLLSLCLLLVSGRRTYGGSSRRGSSSSRTYSRAVPTSKPHVNSQSSNNYDTQRRATNVGTTPRYVVRTQATVRQHPPVTQATVRNYPQQSVYGQKPLYPQQASYPQQNYQSFGQPGYRPYGTYSGNNYYNPSGGYYKHKDHSVRNSVLAGLGGSALGMYLGYQLGGLTHSWNNPSNSGFGMNSGMPQYSVVHHYHHGDKPIIQNAVVEENVIAPCAKDVSMCMSNTTPLCMTNGTIYCVTPIGQTTTCQENSTNLSCVNATITAPCLNSTDGNCNSTQLTTENLQIPCVSNINVFGDFNTNRLQIQGEGTAPNGQNTLTNQGINNRYCVTVIAEPLIEPKDLTNEEYVKYLQKNPYAKQDAEEKAENMMNSIGAYMFF
ncbi:hypothetical protein Trydic_g7344 [Trypoxylus dichotomus]